MYAVRLELYVNDRPVTCRASGPALRFSAVWSWEADGDGCICADLEGLGLR
jgi:hypothetical protein